MAPALKPVYLLAGTDRPKIRTALSRLRGHFEEGDVETLSVLDGATGADAAAACNALGLFGSGRRLVVVEGVDGRRNADGRLTGGWKVADVKALAEHLGQPPPDTVLALVGDEGRKDSPLAKAVVAAKGELLFYEIRRSAWPKWAQEKFAERGAQVAIDACRVLVEIVGESAHALESEIDKIVTWAGGEPITERQIEELAAITADAPVFSVTDAWGRRDVGGALAACEGVFDRSGNPDATDAIRIQAALAAQVERVRTVQRLAADGLPVRDIVTALKLRYPIMVETALAQGRNYDETELRAALVRLAELDRALKGGSRLSGKLEVQRALADVTR